LINYWVGGVRLAINFSKKQLTLISAVTHHISTGFFDKKLNYWVGCVRLAINFSKKQLTLIPAVTHHKQTARNKKPGFFFA
jgi:hypothetical protein